MHACDGWSRAERFQGATKPTRQQDSQHGRITTVGACGRVLSLLKAASVLITMGIMLATSQPSFAAIDPALRPSTKPWFAQFELGPAIELSNSLTQFKMTQAIGYHLFGGGSGPAIGGSLQESFGDDIFTFQIGPRFWWDIQPVSGLGFYLTPLAQLGYGVASGRGNSEHFFNLQFGFELRLALGNTGFVSYRPFTIDMAFGDQVGARYDMLFGGGLLF